MKKQMQIVEGLPNPSELDYKEYPKRPTDNYITVIEFEINGRISKRKYVGKLDVNELLPYSRSILVFEWCESIKVLSLTYYKKAHTNEINAVIKEV